MAQRLTAWVLSHITTLLDLPWPSHDSPPPYSDDKSGVRITTPSKLLPASHIQVLPPELHTEILKYLQWKDILNASLICRTWYRATQSKQLWTSLAKHLESTPGVGHMEEPAQAYSVAELQQWVLKRLRAQESWVVENKPLIFKERKLELPVVVCMKLLPGGRWLLVNDKKGRFYSYDLDLREPNHKLLVDQGSEIDFDRAQQFCYWVDTSKEKLSLRVAFFAVAVARGKSTRTRIYELNLMDHGQNSFLEASPMVSPQDKRVTEMVARPDAVLTGEYFIESLMESGTMSLSVTKYFDSKNKISENITTSRTQLESPLGMHKIYVTPTEQIALIFIHCVLIYTIPQLLGHDKEAVLHPLQYIPCDIGIDFCVSPLWHSEDYMELVYRQQDQDQFWLMRIFVDESPPKNVQLVKHAFHSDDHLGCTIFTQSGVIRLHPDGFADVITYERGVDTESSLVTSTKRTSLPYLDTLTPTLPGPIGVEQGVGRIVLGYQYYPRECFILDTM